MNEFRQALVTSAVVAKVAVRVFVDLVLEVA